MPDKHPSDVATQQLTEELCKTFIRKFEKRKVYWSLKDNIWSADFTVNKKCNKSFYLLLWVIDFFCKYVWAVSLKNKRNIIITIAFQKI